jgi:glycosyltransferase involved in cell wall biosynthesis
LTPYKGADVLLDAVTLIPEAIWGDAVLMIYGGNLERQPASYREKFARLVERAGDRVRFCGAYTNAEMPRLMQSVDWVVVPSIWWENSPVVIQEAFFHGRPLISSNIGGMAEKIADGRNGLHFRVGSAEDLAHRMGQALTQPALWDRLRRGIQPILSHEACAKAHVELYRSLPERHDAPARTGRPDTPALAAGTSH